MALQLLNYHLSQWNSTTRMFRSFANDDTYITISILLFVLSLKRYSCGPETKYVNSFLKYRNCFSIIFKLKFYFTSWTILSFSWVRNDVCRQQIDRNCRAYLRKSSRFDNSTTASISSFTDNNRTVVRDRSYRCTCCRLILEQCVHAKGRPILTAQRCQKNKKNGNILYASNHWTDWTTVGVMTPMCLERE